MIQLKDFSATALKLYKMTKKKKKEKKQKGMEGTGTKISLWCPNECVYMENNLHI